MKAPSRYRPNTSSFAHYWANDVGIDLLKKLANTPDMKNADAFVPYLFQADDRGDALVKDLLVNSSFPNTLRVLETYLRELGNVPLDKRNVLDRFFSQVDTSPAWLDNELLSAGVTFSQRSGLSGLVVLRDYCLMGGYESAAINKPLVYTGALKKGAVKRLAETVEFWVDITGNNALGYGNVGFAGVMKTRIIHSFARISILASTDWDSTKWGLPLNAWDMLATNLGFSLVYLTGLRQMGIVALEREVKGLFHLWKYVGYLLGIPIDLLPEDEKTAIEALFYWTMTQPDGDNDSKAMAKALQEEPLKSHYPPSWLGRRLMREIHLYYNHFLLGRHSCRLLGLDKTSMGKIAYLNIIRNRLQNRRVHDPQYLGQLVRDGRAVHERVRAIYLHAK
ncbi:oxygenase MpaB family protein [Parapedobacter koreensis]|uniref:ER-bound oxygenase mpaB/mpaB'/Rubber oxygenase catalytic domain-containing protein n=1 Tax=Parapedobacter koreensis TaxID=332977 RepID=A0A1H7MJX4_9SPHI|nr:oxygenase MpaB family protein [Parapedobacter koreensis]SEL10907.1 hypothetical protein SAMN05421740_103528 [Parapedobacter koreensis]